MYQKLRLFSRSFPTIQTCVRIINFCW